MSKFLKIVTTLLGILCVLLSFAYNFIPLDLEVHGNLTHGEDSIFCLILGLYCFLSIQIDEVCKNK